MIDREAFVAAWCAGDRARTPLAADRSIVDESTALRAKIAEFLFGGAGDPELYDACAVLGRFVAHRDGSPTLASTTIDAACDALAVGAAADGPADGAWIVSARAAVAEGYCAALLERAQDAAMRTWEFPRCAVFLGDARVAVAAGHPSDDPEILSEWAGRVANAAADAGMRSARVSGTNAARAAIEDAFALAGIAIF